MYCVRCFLLIVVSMTYYVFLYMVLCHLQHAIGLVVDEGYDGEVADVPVVA